MQGLLSCFVAMFSDKSAWFSSSCPTQSIDLWVEHGGKLEDASLAQFIFSEDWDHVDTKGFLTSPEYLKQHLAVFKSSYVLDAVKRGAQNPPLGRYFLVPASVQERLSGLRTTETSVGSGHGADNSKTSDAAKRISVREDVAWNSNSPKARDTSPVNRDVASSSKSVGAAKSKDTARSSNSSNTAETSSVNKDVASSSKAPGATKRFPVRGDVAQTSSSLNASETSPVNRSNKSSGTAKSKDAAPTRNSSNSKAVTGSSKSSDNKNKSPSESSATSDDTDQVLYLPRTSNRTSGLICAPSTRRSQTSPSGTLFVNSSTKKSGARRVGTQLEGYDCTSSVRRSLRWHSAEDGCSTKMIRTEESGKPKDDVTDTESAHPSLRGWRTGSGPESGSSSQVMAKANRMSEEVNYSCDPNLLANIVHVKDLPKVTGVLRTIQPDSGGVVMRMKSQA